MKHSRGDSVILTVITLSFILLVAFFLIRPYVAILMQKILQLFS